MDRRAAVEYGVPALVLMERAGLAVFEAVRSMLFPGAKVAVVCGPGNNGGDGFVVARLCLEAGYAVEVLTTATRDEVREECRQQWLQAEAQGVRPIPYGDPRWARRIQCLMQSDVVVDAVLGIGLEGEVRGAALEAVSHINRSGVPVVSVDVPSGIASDTGAELGESVWATRTVTFGSPKPFLFQGVGLEHAGHWTVAEIGIPSDLLRHPTGASLISGAQVAGLLPERLRSSHKGSNGHVLVVAGSRAYRGSAVLAAKAAMRAGAGVVTVASIDPVLDAVVAAVPECCCLPLPEQDGAVSPDAAETLLCDQHRFTAAVFGPGLTTQPGVRAMLGRAWSRWETPCCLDADALNALAMGVELPPCEALLTPHPGEMGRLLERPAPAVQADRFGSARDAVAATGKSVLLKGPYSILGSAGEPLVVNTTGNSGMASAGMGDVLAGVVAALMGQGLSAADAGMCAMYWHGLAGDECAIRIGPTGYGASEVADALAPVRAKLASCSFASE